MLPAEGEPAVWMSEDRLPNSVLEDEGNDWGDAGVEVGDGCEADGGSGR